MIDAVTMIAGGAVLANVFAIGSGWTVLVAHPEFLRQTVGKAFNFSPVYLCYALVMTTTALSMFLSVLLAWWFTQPEIRSSDTLAAEIFMSYHLLTGVVATALHVLIAMIAEGLLEPTRVGGIEDADAAKGTVCSL